MRLLDLNILVYAMDESSSRHEAARDWLDETLSGSDTVALAWHVLIGLVRL
jgi:predicted nucleic acid-binding protein